MQNQQLPKQPPKRCIFLIQCFNSKRERVYYNAISIQNDEKLSKALDNVKVNDVVSSQTCFVNIKQLR